MGDGLADESVGVRHVAVILGRVAGASQRIDTNEADAGVQESLFAERRELGNNLAERKVRSA